MRLEAGLVGAYVESLQFRLHDGAFFAIFYSYRPRLIQFFAATKHNKKNVFRCGGICLGFKETTFKR